MTKTKERPPEIPGMPTMPDDILNAMRLQDALTPEQERRAEEAMQEVFRYMRQQRTAGIVVEPNDR